MGKDKHHHKEKKNKHRDSDEDDKERHRREKDSLKANETEEEKRERRLAKKLKKHGADATFNPATATIGGYTNDANPWNDPNLMQSFVWGKKDERDRTRGIAPVPAKRKREELQVEIERVKLAREQREREKDEAEEERRLLDREREQMAFHENESREDAFQLQQTYLRANIRVKEGRAKAIDAVAQSLAVLSGGVEPEDALEMHLQAGWGWG